MSRSDLREAIKSQIEAVYSGTVSIDRRFAAGKTQEFIIVSLSSGSVESNGIGVEQVSAVEIAVYKTGIPTDADLDAVGDKIDEGLAADITLGGNAAGIIYKGFEYLVDDQDQFSVLELRYSIIH